ncbi:MAG: hypothetical protein JSU63_03175 [Phycisphaerales bacterium]|nr:MAG: hypothetical protein JSU63_03175 [Phycisphaerales bacterium]
MAAESTPDIDESPGDLRSISQTAFNAFNRGFFAYIQCPTERFFCLAVVNDRAEHGKECRRTGRPAAVALEENGIIAGTTGA